IIATMVRAFAGKVDKVVIVSSDKDLMQLVADDSVLMLDTMKDRWVDEEAVSEKFGVKPVQVVHVQALMGDPSDNIPGLAGVGPKTAGKLI
ncbi:MAG: DNA polymerase I, partial [Thermoplasmata archaeon]|nr:DNA polymerase I [Thermoplasmata archaeon]NIS12255.1 DNA polymerase I [Thermoplasmata archaeon]NIS20169.1 DNA polymerase I [Thermoplasmata archaeon]NIU49267.1 DNA polymerase I [Thermoplasmata archaeon]NIV78938.1 DNA polymerase I [Thermoplasmata archaeon]